MTVAREGVRASWEDNGIGVKTSNANKRRIVAIEPWLEFSVLSDNRKCVTMKAAPNNEIHILQVGGGRPEFFTDVQIWPLLLQSI